MVEVVGVARSSSRFQRDAQVGILRLAVQLWPEAPAVRLQLDHLTTDHPVLGAGLDADGEEVYRVLRQVVEVMRQGKATLVAPQGLLLTTQEAADFLGVSRPTLVKLLEDGAIPFEKPNRHRRVRLQDLLDFRARRQEQQRAALDQLTEEASELGLYEGTPADYASALKSARRRRARTESE